MKIFAFIVLCLSILLFIVLPGIDNYNKHRDGTKKEALKHALKPLLFYIGSILSGFILFEIMPRILGQVIENIL